MASNLKRGCSNCTKKRGGNGVNFQQVREDREGDGDMRIPSVSLGAWNFFIQNWNCSHYLDEDNKFGGFGHTWNCHYLFLSFPYQNVFHAEIVVLNTTVGDELQSLEHVSSQLTKQSGI